MNKERKKDDQAVLTLRRVAIVLDCSKAHVRKMVYAGALPAFHRGRVLVVKRKDVLKYVDKLLPVEIE